MIQELSLDLFGENFTVFANPQAAEEKRGLARALTKDGAHHAAEAAVQENYAAAARASAAAAAPAESRAELAGIAAWHYERSAAGFRRAAVSFESAAKIRTAENARRRLLKKAAGAAEAAMRAERRARELTGGAKKMTGGLKDETG